MDEGMFVADGINASTGAPLFEPQSVEELVAVARGGDSTDDAELLKARRERDDNSHFGVAEGIDRGDLAQTGWGVIFPAVKPGTDEEKRQAAIREALSPLLRHRQRRRAPTSRGTTASCAAPRVCDRASRSRSFSAGSASTRAPRPIPSTFRTTSSSWGRRRRSPSRSSISST